MLTFISLGKIDSLTLSGFFIFTKFLGEEKLIIQTIIYFLLQHDDYKN